MPGWPHADGPASPRGVLSSKTAGRIFGSVTLPPQPHRSQLMPSWAVHCAIPRLWIPLRMRRQGTRGAPPSSERRSAALPPTTLAGEGPAATRHRPKDPAHLPRRPHWRVAVPTMTAAQPPSSPFPSPLCCPHTGVALPTKQCQGTADAWPPPPHPRHTLKPHWTQEERRWWGREAYQCVSPAGPPPPHTSSSSIVPYARPACGACGRHGSVGTSSPPPPVHLSEAANRWHSALSTAYVLWSVAAGHATHGPPCTHRAPVLALTCRAA